MSEDATAADVAAWMLEQLTAKKYLEQETAVVQIQRRFGRQFVYHNEAGNLAIDRKVLAAFRKASGDDVVWERGERAWRRRKPGDAKTRQQE